MTSTSIQPYLFFGGRCDEAIEFYRKGLGAELEILLRYKDSPDPPPPGMLQPGFEDKVMHAALRVGGAVLMASDGCDDKMCFDGFRLSLALPAGVTPNGHSPRFPTEARCRCRSRKLSFPPVSAWSPTASASAGWSPWRRRRPLESSFLTPH